MYSFFNSENPVAVAALSEEQNDQPAQPLPLDPNWKYFTYRGLGTIKRVFDFKNLNDAMSFAARIQKLAEFEGISPVLLVEWGKNTVGWHIHTPNVGIKDLSLIHKIEASYRFFETLKTSR